MLNLLAEANKYVIFSPILDAYYKNNKGSIDLFRRQLNVFDNLYYFKSKFVNSCFSDGGEFGDYIDKYFPPLYCKRSIKGDDNLEFYEKCRNNSIACQKYYRTKLNICQETKEWFVYFLLELDPSPTDHSYIELYIHFRTSIIQYLLESELSMISMNFITALYISQSSEHLRILNINAEVNNALISSRVISGSSNHLTLEEFFVNFKLNHKIWRSKIKEIKTNYSHNEALSDFDIFQ